jgi:hypothetical protein
MKLYIGSDIMCLNGRLNSLVSCRYKVLYSIKAPAIAGALKGRNGP